MAERVVALAVHTGAAGASPLSPFASALGREANASARALPAPCKRNLDKKIRGFAGA